MKRSKQKGITLIALVITIIVLLILAGVSIATLTGQNGILTQANNAKIQTAEAKDLEQVKLAVSTGVSENLTTGRNVNEAIQEELRKTDPAATVVGDGDEKEITYNGKLYNVNIKTGEVEESTEEIQAKKAIKIVVNSGEDGLVILPFDAESGTIENIDWGDENVFTGNKNLIIKQKKVASLNENLKLSATVPLPGLYYHTYEEKNKEFEVTIQGDILTMDSIATYSYWDKESQEMVNYNNGIEKIIEITQWGETGLRLIELSECINLRKIASPSINSFKDVEEFSFESTGIKSIPEDLFINAPKTKYLQQVFAHCINLESLPQNLFDNCNNIENLRWAFSGCTNLRGNAIPLWEKAEGYELLDPNEFYGWWDLIPHGDGCYQGCINLDNYSEIPIYWREGPM